MSVITSSKTDLRYFIELSTFYNKELYSKCFSIMSIFPSQFYEFNNMKNKNLPKFCFNWNENFFILFCICVFFLRGFVEFTFIHPFLFNLGMLWFKSSFDITILLESSANCYKYIHQANACLLICNHFPCKHIYLFLTLF